MDDREPDWSDRWAGSKPPEIPRWLWFAVADLYGQRERLDGEEMNAAQIAQDSEEGRHEWCRLAAELLNTHMAAARKAQRMSPLGREMVDGLKRYVEMLERGEG